MTVFAEEHGRRVLPLTIPSPWKGENAYEWFWVLEAAAIAVAFVFHSVTEDWAIWQRLAGIAGAALFFAFSWLQARAILRPTLRKDARIEVGPSGLLIKGENLFEEPIRVERSRVRLVAFDDSPIDVKDRFPVAGPVGDTPKERERNSFLFRKDRRGPLPTDPAHHLDEMPNMAIVLSTPIQLPGRRNFRTLLIKPQYFVNQWIRAITLRVVDVDAALAAFEEWEVVRSPTGEDIAALRPSPDESRQLKKLERIQWIGLTVTVVALFGIPIIYIASTS